MGSEYLPSDYWRRGGGEACTRKNAKTKLRCSHEHRRSKVASTEGSLIEVAPDVRSQESDRGGSGSDVLVTVVVTVVVMTFVVTIHTTLLARPVTRVVISSVDLRIRRYLRVILFFFVPVIALPALFYLFAAVLCPISVSLPLCSEPPPSVLFGVSARNGLQRVLVCLTAQAVLPVSAFWMNSAS